MLLAAQITDLTLLIHTLLNKGRFNGGDRLDDLKQHNKQLIAENKALRRALEAEKERAFRDSLTGIANRRAYEQRLEEEINRSNRSDKPFSLLVWDIDNFKQINDRFGHQIGDQILIAIAGELNSQVRSCDFSARFGGEEFVSIIPDCPLSQAYNIAEGLRSKIAGKSIATSQGDIHVTLSCGIAEFTPNSDANELFERADQALYQAKKQGKNRISRSD
ncbi:diguanylate cyclase (GGDEF) domain-containing protein [Amphritea atlantica]|uniref:diguanylate cyclase n=1 Tax=Amphritea atlantica TaxID=355243 RepID=A0A1H9HBQ9_9GAMM|nr:GGDEF domain-containing protein [Amphritea atlantica]SEQ59723.1 diguanylate cyclase (GGDEF) domain-containing protein [Amphritea atlantica]